ncbi:MAG TPA: transcriptional regulator NrdR [Ilumatobacteraceae bacterium]|nr:transcriptional regulator NrdR [Ilumatobacteraceae bacterium]
MHCPSCRADDTKVVDSRLADEGCAIRRRRLCAQCSHRFTTYERVEELPLMVVKSGATREPFDRAKVVSGVLAACKGRPVSSEQIHALAISVEDAARLHGNEVTSAAVGAAVLDRLRELDEVAYLRFASVYKNFDAAGDFAEELQLLHKLQTPSH